MQKILMFFLAVLFLLLGWLVGLSSAQDSSPLQECTVTNLTLTDADTEYSHEIIPGSKLVSVKARTANSFKYTWVASASGTTYRTVPSGVEYYLVNAWFMNRRVLYFQSTTATLVLEIETCL